MRKTEVKSLFLHLLNLIVPMYSRVPTAAVIRAWSQLAMKIFARTNTQYECGSIAIEGP